MARPVQLVSLDGVSTAQTGEVLQTGDRPNLVIFAIAENLDPANDTIELDLEISQDMEHWAKARDATGTHVMHVTETEFDDPDGSGDYAAYLRFEETASDAIRANLVSIDDNEGDDLALTVYVGGTGDSDAHTFRTIE